VKIAKSLDESCEVYLFGSVAEGRSLPSSDVDVLIVTTLRPEQVLSEMWRNGVKEPFEIHVVPPSLLERYRARSKLVRLG
jgi:predicted nucleotidyltransferase